MLSFINISLTEHRHFMNHSSNGLFKFDIIWGNVYNLFRRGATFSLFSGGQSIVHTQCRPPPPNFIVWSNLAPRLNLYVFHLFEAINNALEIFRASF